MRDYEQLVTRRDTSVDGIGPWYWLRSDSGAWDGPKRDWEESHKHKFLSHVKDFSLCVQAGSCLGMYPRILAEHFEHVWTFEPDPLNFYVMNLNCQLDNVHKFNAALGQFPGTIGLKRADQSNVGMHRTEGLGFTQVLTVDSLNLPSLGLMVLDVEGYEIKVLAGAVKTIRKFSPVITAENGNGEVKDFLKTLGYEVVTQSISDTVFVSVS